eukprot:TRINITY_DN528_c0_g2_i1.p1 TRINITY_DN528_c0_g2~~TRINITY_DN528_c0_g2_i1.p1  ORF type:complete len:329 (-),score=76.72 TRINITY_DN528_c0_g2_i1:48-1034(-)
MSGYARSPNNIAAMKIAKDLKTIKDEPVEGIYCEIVDESNIFEWYIYFEGPSESPYQGGIFQAKMTFPQDYPMSPPTLEVLSDFWHPNVYKGGKVCISILHPPGKDDMSGELAEERWLPTQTVSTIMLSFQSMLSDPNINSPANLDASVQWRDNRQDFLAKTKLLAEKASKRVPAHVKIPHPDTDPEERSRNLEKMKTKLELASSFSLHDMNASEDSGFEDYEEDASISDEVEYEDEDGGTTEIVDCPVCQATMLYTKNYFQCALCPIQHKDGAFLCGRKCYMLDCGEVLPTGVCDAKLSANNKWKCVNNYHKDDPNGEDNFLAVCYS